MVKCDKCGDEMDFYNKENYSSRNIFVCVNPKCRDCGKKAYVRELKELKQNSKINIIKNEIKGYIRSPNE